MTNSGLTSRLRQQSRRTGFAVGMAMAVTILLCVGGFVVIYAQVDPLTRDFIAAPATETPTEEPRSADSAESQPNNQDQQDAQASTGTAEDQPAQPTPTSTPEEAQEPTSTPETFTPTHISNTQQGVNFRAGPGTDADIITTLEASTPLRATGQQGTGDDGLVWLEFETEDGTIGWIREIDAVPQG
jgi:cytoskeletal protein RodZ